MTAEVSIAWQQAVGIQVGEDDGRRDRSMTISDRYSVTEDEIRFDRTAEERLYQRLFDFWHPVAYSSHLADDKPLGSDPARRGHRGGPSRRPGAGLPRPVRASGYGPVAGLGGGRLAPLRLPRLEVRAGRHVHRDPLPFRYQDPPKRARLTRYAAAEAAGLIWVCMSGEPRYPLPEFPYRDDPEVPDHRGAVVRLELLDAEADRELRRLRPLRLGSRRGSGRPQPAGGSRPRHPPSRPRTALRPSPHGRAPGLRQEQGSGLRRRTRRRPDRLPAVHAQHDPPRPADSRPSIRDTSCSSRSARPAARHPGASRSWAATTPWTSRPTGTCSTSTPS